MFKTFDSILIFLVISKIEILTPWAFGDILVCLSAVLGTYVLVSFEIHSLGHSSVVAFLLSM